MKTGIIQRSVRIMRGAETGDFTGAVGTWSGVDVPVIWVSQTP